MSAIASFIKFPKKSLEGLREAAVPKKRFLFKPRDMYGDYLQKYGKEVVAYEWSGYVLGTLLPYLQEECQIDLMKSEFDELSGFLSESRGNTIFIFTVTHKQDCLEKLTQEFSESTLRDYYNEFNETDEPEIGLAMIDGIKAFRESLEHVDNDSVILFSIE